MKRILIDCDTCRKRLTKEEGVIEIGSNTEHDLAFDNTLGGLKTGSTKSISRYTNLHFCSKEHFVEYFFGKEVPPE